MNPRKAAVLFLLAASPCAGEASEIPWGSDTQLTQWGKLDITEPSGREVRLYFWRDKYREGGGPITFYVLDGLSETSSRSMERPPTGLEDLSWMSSNSGPRGPMGPVRPRPTYHKNVTVQHYQARIYQARCSVTEVQRVNDTTANIYGEIRWEGTQEAGGWGTHHRKRPALDDDWIRVLEPVRGAEGLVVPETSPFSEFREFPYTSPTFQGLQGRRSGNVVVASHFTALEIILGNGHNTSARVWLAPDEISAAAAERRWDAVEAFVLRTRPQLLDETRALYDHVQANLSAAPGIFTGREQRLLGDLIHNGDSTYEADGSDAYKDYYFARKRPGERLDEDNGYRWIEPDFFKELQRSLRPAENLRAFVRKYRLYMLSELYLAARAAQPRRERSGEIPDLREDCKAQKRRIALTVAGSSQAGGAEQLAANERQAELPWPGAVARLDAPTTNSGLPQTPGTPQSAGTLEENMRRVQEELWRRP